MQQILNALENSEGLIISEILAQVNVSRSMLEKALKLLEVDGAVGVAFESRRTVHFRTPNPWLPETERIERITKLRRARRACFSCG